MADTPPYKGHDRYRDLPMLGVDPDMKSSWEPVDDGRRPDNRGPEHFVRYEGTFGSHPAVSGPKGIRPDIGRPEREGPFYSDGDGRALMEYHRELATAQVMSKSTNELTTRTVAL